MSEKAVMPLEDYKRACDYLRYHTDTTESIKSGELTDKIDALYIKANSDGIQSGYAQGYTEGYADGKAEGGDTETAYNEGVEAGKQAEYDAHWDGLQNYGNRTNYAGGFRYWSNEYINPKHTIKTKSMSEIFYTCSKLKKSPTVIPLNDTGVTSIYNAYCSCAELESIDYDIILNLTSYTEANSAFAHCRKVKIIKKIVINGVCPTFNNAFTNDGELEEIRFEGVIDKNGLNFQHSTKLSKASHISIVNCLSVETSGLTVTLSLTAVKKAFETSSGANDGNTSEEWLNLIATKPNWTINLV